MGFEPFDLEQAFVQSELLDSEMYLQLPSGCGAMPEKVVRLSKSFYGLKQASRQWRQLVLSHVKDFGCEQCLVDPFVPRLVDGEVTSMTVMDVDDISFADTAMW